MDCATRPPLPITLPLSSGATATRKTSRPSGATAGRDRLDPEDEPPVILLWAVTTDVIRGGTRSP